MTLKNALLLCCATALLFSYCCKEDSPVPAAPALPPETQTGANTFGCKVNGEVFLPQGAGLAFGSSLDYDNGTFLLYASRVQEKRTVRIDFEKKIYNTNSYNFIGSDYTVFRDKDEIFNIDSLHAGFLTITKLDTIKRIVAGRFYFDAISNTKEVIHITEGRFDYHY